MLHLNNFNKKAIIILSTLLISALCRAQNVGVGIAVPTEKLHIYQPASAIVNNTLYMQAANTNGRNVIKMQNSTGNSFTISKISPTEIASNSGVVLSGGASIINDDNGPIFISNSNFAKSIYMAANGKVNLTIDGPTGGLFVRPSKTYNFTANTETDLGIRRDTLNEFQSWLEMRDSSNSGNIAGFMSTNASLDGFGPRIQFGNNSFGATKVTFWTDNSSPRMFIHENGNVGIGMPTFADPGAKLYVNGQLKITDGNQLNGRVLTTDNSGLARWQDLPGGAGAWNVSGADIQNSNAGIVKIGTPLLGGLNSKLVVSSNSNSTDGNIAIHENESDYARIQFTNQNSTGNNYWHLAGFNDNVSVNNDRFNIYHGGAGNIMSVSADGKVGINNSNPLVSLHIQESRSGIPAKIIAESIGSSYEASIDLKTTSGIFDRLEIRKWGTAAGGTVAGGIPISGLSSVVAGVNTQAGMLVGTLSNYPLYFTTGNQERMQISADGKVGIGTTPTEKLEINNGFLKVSGANKTAFTITATGANSSGHILTLSYANQASTDIIMVTHNYSPSGGPSAYHNYNVGVYWNGSTWTIFNENTAIPILGISFNVMIIKQ